MNVRSVIEKIFPGTHNGKKTGLALGGGAVLGAAHVGVLRAIEEYGIKVDAVAGTSIGALVAALYAFGRDWKDIGEVARHLHWFDISSVSPSQYGLLNNQKMGKKICDLLGDVTFKDTLIPLAIVTADISSGEKVVLREGNVGNAVMASSCIPGIFKPVQHDGRMLVDGGIMENVPIQPLRDMGMDYVIGVDLNTRHSYKKPRHIIDVIMNATLIMMNTATKIQASEADLMLSPDLSDYNLVDTSQVDDLIEEGYREAREGLWKL